VWILQGWTDQYKCQYESLNSIRIIKSDSTVALGFCVSRRLCRKGLHRAKFHYNPITVFWELTLIYVNLCLLGYFFSFMGNFEFRLAIVETVEQILTLNTTNDVARMCLLKLPSIGLMLFIYLVESLKLPQKGVRRHFNQITKIIKLAILKTHSLIAISPR